jgi:hypothetical protein
LSIDAQPILHALIRHTAWIVIVFEYTPQPFFAAVVRARIVVFACHHGVDGADTLFADARFDALGFQLTWLAVVGGGFDAIPGGGFALGHQAGGIGTGCHLAFYRCAQVLLAVEIGFVGGKDTFHIAQTPIFRGGTVFVDDTGAEFVSHKQAAGGCHTRVCRAGIAVVTLHGFRRTRAQKTAVACGAIVSVITGLTRCGRKHTTIGPRA